MELAVPNFVLDARGLAATRTDCFGPVDFSSQRLDGGPSPSGYT